MGDVSRRRLVLLDGAAALGFALLPQLTLVRPDSGGAPGGLTVSLLSFATALPLAVRRLWPVPVFAIVLVASCVALAAGLGPAVFLSAAYALYLVATTRRRQLGRSAVIVGGASTAGAALLTVTGGQHYTGGTLAVQLLFGLLVLGATWAAGTAVRERRESLRRTIVQAAEQAKVEERMRIARDIHDVVTHSVGLIAIKAGVANHVIATHPEEAREALTVIEDISRRALRDMRATLKVLRREHVDQQQDLQPVPGLSDLPSLVRTAEAAGVSVDLRSDCAEEPPDGVALTAFRIVQEALTNVVKHAAPTRCLVSVTAQDGVLTIGVTDDGPGPGHRPTVPGGDMGLVGMRERAVAHGGTLTAGPRPGAGFRILATLPY
ncbi:MULTISPECIES: sensor histidine kinase [Streptomyces]|jgi:signal transduction histidine kinase|uniref:sensor histidine kinase n=1 Tax=Streptomyces TaxID=1883 RepID=UPI000BCDAC02|nr:MULTISPECIES: sensor histidine kinase [Streptomyces]MCT9106922.1 sensor histidine kinase [Streptomyces mirabilis]MCX4438223.1 sensor histidine kinase [Streptomyces mirabilis]SOE56310.1 Signal transduction histidine kinase [Streptomyces sp. OV198]